MNYKPNGKSRFNVCFDWPFNIASLVHFCRSTCCIIKGVKIIRSWTEQDLYFTTPSGLQYPSTPARLDWFSVCPGWDRQRRPSHLSCFALKEATGLQSVELADPDAEPSFISYL